MNATTPARPMPPRFVWRGAHGRPGAAGGLRARRCAARQGEGEDADREPHVPDNAGAAREVRQPRAKRALAQRDVGDAVDVERDLRLRAADRADARRRAAATRALRRRRSASRPIAKRARTSQPNSPASRSGDLRARPSASMNVLSRGSTRGRSATRPPPQKRALAHPRPRVRKLRVRRFVIAAFQTGVGDVEIAREHRVDELVDRRRVERRQIGGGDDDQRVLGEALHPRAQAVEHPRTVAAHLARAGQRGMRRRRRRRDGDDAVDPRRRAQAGQRALHHRDAADAHERLVGRARFERGDRVGASAGQDDGVERPQGESTHASPAANGTTCTAASPARAAVARTRARPLRARTARNTRRPNPTASRGPAAPAASSARSAASTGGYAPRTIGSKSLLIVASTAAKSRALQRFAAAQRRRAAARPRRRRARAARRCASSAYAGPVATCDRRNGKHDPPRRRAPERGDAFAGPFDQRRAVDQEERHVRARARARRRPSRARPASARARRPSPRAARRRRRSSRRRARRPTGMRLRSVTANGASRQADAVERADDEVVGRRQRRIATRTRIARRARMRARRRGRSAPSRCAGCGSRRRGARGSPA